MSRAKTLLSDSLSIVDPLTCSRTSISLFGGLDQTCWRRLPQAVSPTNSNQHVFALQNTRALPSDGPLGDLRQQPPSPRTNSLTVQTSLPRGGGATSNIVM